MSRGGVRWERTFPDELEAANAACPVVYFPQGLCEPHGPHCALGPSAREADRRVGERMVADEIRWLARKAEELRADHGRTPSGPRLRTFADVERLWATVTVPRLPEFETMRPWGDDPPPVIERE